jgi:hypothetical protein
MLARQDWRDDAPADQLVAAAWRNLALVDTAVAMEQKDWIGTFCQRLNWVPYKIHENRSNMAIVDGTRLRARHLRHGRLDLLARSFRHYQPAEHEVRALTAANQLDIQLYDRLRSAPTEIRLVGPQRSASQPRSTSVHGA